MTLITLLSQLSALGRWETEVQRGEVTCQGQIANKTNQNGRRAYLGIFCWLSPGCELWTLQFVDARPRPHPKPSMRILLPYCQGSGLGGQDRLSGPRPLPSFPCCTPINDLYGFLSQRWLQNPGASSWSHGPVCTPCPYPETLRKFLSHPSGPLPAGQCSPLPDRLLR